MPGALLIRLLMGRGIIDLTSNYLLANDIIRGGTEEFFFVHSGYEKWFA